MFSIENGFFKNIRTNWFYFSSLSRNPNQGPLHLMQKNIEPWFWSRFFMTELGFVLLYFFLFSSCLFTFLSFTFEVYISFSILIHYISFLVYNSSCPVLRLQFLYLCNLQFIFIVLSFTFPALYISCNLLFSNLPFSQFKFQSFIFYCNFHHVLV